MLQKLTAEQRREAARQFTYFEENVRGAFVGGKKRTRLMKVTFICTALVWFFQVFPAVLDLVFMISRR